MCGFCNVWVCVCVGFVMCVCVCVCVCVFISDCVDISYLLSLLPNKTASETFLQKLGAVRNVAGYLLLGRRPGGEWANA